MSTDNQEVKELFYAVQRMQIHPSTAMKKYLELRDEQLERYRTALERIANTPLDTQTDEWYSETAKETLGADHE